MPNPDRPNPNPSPNPNPEVPVLDLIDLPGIVAVDVPGVTPAGKVDAVERVISAQVGLVGRGLST